MKVGGTPEDAIRQIKEKEYYLTLKEEQVEKILIVGINYDKVTKEHHCKIEVLH